jgi:hypothetical protein
LSPLRSSAALALALLFTSCQSPDGSARVVAHFKTNQCGLGQTADNLMNYNFDAAYMQTERFGGAMIIGIQKYRVSIEETDGLQIRIDLVALLNRGLLTDDRARHQIIRTDPTKPLVLATSTASTDANAVLSLFTTCPDFPSSEARSGVLSFDKLTLAEDPTNTGENERIGGTLTATLSRAYTSTAVGTLDAVFDFAPPRRPLTVFN